MNSRAGGTRALALRGALAGRTVLERTDQILAPIVPKDRPGLLFFIFHCAARFSSPR